MYLYSYIKIKEGKSLGKIHVEQCSTSVLEQKLSELDVPQR